MTLCTTVDIGGIGGGSRQKQKEVMEKEQVGGGRGHTTPLLRQRVRSLSQGCQIKTNRNNKGKGGRRKNRLWVKA